MKTRSAFFLFLITPFLTTEYSASQAEFWESANGPRGGEVYSLAVSTSGYDAEPAYSSDAPPLSDSILSFFPLHTGDFWQYVVYDSNNFCPSGDPFYSTLEVIGDTLMSNGHTYKIVGSWYLRVDTASANVYRFDDPFGDCLIDSLRADVGSSFTSCGGIPTECTSVDTITVLGTTTTTKQFWQYFVFGAGYTLARGFGKTQVINNVDGGVCPPYLEVHDLVYARIDSVEYGTLVDVMEDGGLPPASFVLEQNYPNPFNPSTTIQYAVPKISHIALKIYDVLGREVATLADQVKSPGKYASKWDASGKPSGIYFYRLRAGDLVETKKLVVLQ